MIKNLAVTTLILTVFISLVQCKNTEKESKIVLQDPWISEAMPGSDITSGYMKIVNQSGADDVLESVTSESVGTVEIHQMVHENNVMRMEKIERLPIPDGKETVLSPGGYHLMLIGLKKNFKEGDSEKLVLKFKISGAKEIVMPVKKMDAQTQNHMHNH